MTTTQEEEESVQSSFREKESFVAFISDLIAGSVIEGSATIERKLEIIDLYQMQPQLLDPHLSDLIDPLQNELIVGIVGFGNMGEVERLGLWKRAGDYCRVLYRITKTRGNTRAKGYIKRSH